MSKSMEAGRIIGIGFICAVTVFSIGGMIFMLKVLISPWWIPVITAIVIGKGLALPMRGLWKWVTKSDNIPLNLICHLLFTIPFLICVGLSVNYATSGRNIIHEKAIVERVYRETRYKTRRVSRKVYTRGAPYYAYCMELRLPTGNTRDIDVKKKIYDRLSKEDTVGIDVSKGILGLLVFDAGNIHLNDSQTAERKKESAREKRIRKYREHMDRVSHRKNTDNIKDDGR